MISYYKKKTMLENGEISILPISALLPKEASFLSKKLAFVKKNIVARVWTLVYPIHI